MTADKPVETLIVEARGGDRAAFERLASLHRSRLEGLFHSRLGPALRERLDLDDLIQETFLRALRSVSEFEPRGEDSFFRWLAGIAGHVILETARKQKRDLILALDRDLPADQVSASTATQRDERFERLQQALDSLSDDHRRVVLLARVDRLPIKEVAQRMERTPEAVSQLLWRALQKLKTAFGETDSFRLPDRRLEDRGNRIQTCDHHDDAFESE